MAPPMAPAMWSYPRRGVDGQGAEHVERGAVGHLFDADDLRLDFVHRHMAGAFDHALHAVFEAALGKRAEGHDFFPTGRRRPRRIPRRGAGRRRATGSRCTCGPVRAGGHTPVSSGFSLSFLSIQRARIDPPRDTMPRARSPRAAHSAPAPGQAAMQGHEVHALLRLHFDFGEQFFGIDVGGIAILVDVALRHRVQRHRAEWQRRARAYPCGSPRDRRQWTDP